MAGSGDISFELERFEWTTPERLGVEGRWHGVRRRLPPATLVVEVDGERRRLRALPDSSMDPLEPWTAAFPWRGEMPVLPGAELEVGRGIVVDLPRPRRSRARAAAAAGAPAAPIPATSREDRDAIPGREEAERLLAVLTAARVEADEAAARAAAAEAEAAKLRARVQEVEAEAATLRARVEEAEGETGDADEVDALRARLEEAESEAGSLRAR